jgi:hypothetical protein
MFLWVSESYVYPREIHAAILFILECSSNKLKQCKTLTNENQ